MADTRSLTNYKKRHSTIDGADGLYVDRELDTVSRSIQNINDFLKSLVAQRQVTQDANATTTLADMERQWYHTSASPHTWTIDSNANMAAPIGATMTFVNDGAGVVTIAITSDTLIWAPSGTVGSRTLPQYGFATARKIAATRWLINGPGLA